MTLMLEAMGLKNQLVRSYDSKWYLTLQEVH